MLAPDSYSMCKRGREFMVDRNWNRKMQLAALFAASFFVPSVQSQTAPAQPTPSTSHAERFRSGQLPNRAREYYALIWGIDSLVVKSAESGELIRFSYRVIDADKAKMLNDKKAEPALVDPAAGVRLVVPSMEKVGKLRQSSSPENGKSYWMAFSNKGGYVRPGHRVNVVIGEFHADGLVVE